MIVHPPRYPVNQLVSFELRDYRRQLESAMSQLPQTAPLRQVYSDRLAEVITEQEVHAASTGIPAGWSDAS